MAPKQGNVINNHIVFEWFYQKLRELNYRRDNQFREFLYTRDQRQFAEYKRLRFGERNKIIMRVYWLKVVKIQRHKIFH